MTFILPFAAAWATPLFSGYVAAGGIVGLAQNKMTGTAKDLFILVGALGVVISAVLIELHLLSGSLLSLLGGLAFGFLTVMYLKSNVG